MDYLSESNDKQRFLQSLMLIFTFNLLNIYTLYHWNKKTNFYLKPRGIKFVFVLLLNLTYDFNCLDVLIIPIEEEIEHVHLKITVKSSNQNILLSENFCISKETKGFILIASPLTIQKYTWRHFHATSTVESLKTCYWIGNTKDTLEFTLQREL